MVGAVIVRDGVIIGRGYHEAYGGPHAERNALSSCVEPTEGATLYVTLEPCCHHGRTPPCTDAILSAGISRVVVGMGDPNPLVNGGGVGILRQNGVTVDLGVQEAECRSLNRIFSHFITTGTPFVTMKYAMTLDGKIAARTGLSRWITGPEARARVHETRHGHMALMVGVGTVIADDPMLTCRLDGGRNPIRIVVDTNLRTPVDSRLVRTAGETPTIIVTCCQDREKREPYESAGVRIMRAESSGGRVDLAALMRRLGGERVDSVLLEGGGELNYSALAAGVVNRIHAYVAPKIFGGAGAKSPVGGLGVADPSVSFTASDWRITPLGRDILIEAEVKY
jgi:diaminohydroxyphosphoribosylaminopyrimidine deaminase/5-amino-6-(5-phosphoribosylamino)uracil reductase